MLSILKRLHILWIFYDFISCLFRATCTTCQSQRRRFQILLFDFWRLKGLLLRPSSTSPNSKQHCYYTIWAFVGPWGVSKKRTGGISTLEKRDMAKVLGVLQRRIEEPASHTNLQNRKFVLCVDPPKSSNGIWNPKKEFYFSMASTWSFGYLLDRSAT